MKKRDEMRPPHLNNFCQDNGTALKVEVRDVWSPYALTRRFPKITAWCVCRRNVSALKVRLGDWDIHQNVEPRPYVERSVASVTIHPGYSSTTMHNDVAVIALSEAVTWSGHIGAACLPPEPQLNGTVSPRHQWSECRVSGWGTESFERPRYPGVLKKVGVPLWDRDRCVRSLRTTRLGGKFKLHEGFLCAGGEEHEDACKASVTYYDLYIIYRLI